MSGRRRFYRVTQIIVEVENEQSRDDSQIDHATREVVVAQQRVPLGDEAVPSNVAALFRDPDAPTMRGPG